MLQEEKQKAYRREKRKNLKRKANNDLDEGDDEGKDEMAAIMGFSGFGTSAKKWDTAFPLLDRQREKETLRRNEIWGLKFPLIWLTKGEKGLKQEETVAFVWY